MRSILCRVGGALDAFFDAELGALDKGVRLASREIEAEATRFSDALESSRQELARSARQCLEARVRTTLASMRLEDLKEHLPKRLRWSRLAEAGVVTLADVGAWGGADRLKQIDGVGKGTADALEGAYVAFREAEWQRGAPVPRVPAQTDVEARLLCAAVNIARCRQQLEQDLPRVQEGLRNLQGQIKGRRTGLTGAFRNLWEGRPTEEVKAELREFKERLEALKHSPECRRLLEARERLVADPQVLRDAERGSELVRGLSGDIASVVSREFQRQGVREDDAGSLPKKLAREVEAFPLHEGLRARELRPYQAFGAKYLLLQERTLLGDDMGLGKTSQALAAFVHCSKREQARHFLVVCPTGVMDNWRREVEQYTPLKAFRLHGRGRDGVLGAWLRHGGVGITSYGTLGALSLPKRLAQEGKSLDFLVADEAHNLKNFETKRTQFFDEVNNLAGRVCLMTGTPLENRPGEMLNLLALVDPDLADKVDRGLVNVVLGVPNPVSFLEQISPAYLRRNRQEVLHELPEEIVMDEQVRIPWGERTGYWARLKAGCQLHDLRRSLVVGDERMRTAKMERILEIVEEYRREGSKVVIFSYYRRVLEVLADHLEGSFPVVGTITGSVPDVERQRLIDRLAAHSGTAVLLSQIQAGGIGLNMQCANVCILTEPQWKPSMERQAIARLSRMGQDQTVFVHRLIAHDSVDERMEEILAQKGAWFQTYAEQSAVADSSHEAKESTWSQRILEYELERMHNWRRDDGPEDELTAGLSS